MFTEERIAALEKMGFKRWQKNGMDRLYISSTRAGLECEFYKTGNIRCAELNGQHISNSRARAIIDAKNWIDLTDGSIHSPVDEIRENIARMMEAQE